MNLNPEQLRRNHHHHPTHTLTGPFMKRKQELERYTKQYFHLANLLALGKEGKKKTREMMVMMLQIQVGSGQLMKRGGGGRRRGKKSPYFSRFQKQAVEAETALWVKWGRIIYLCISSLSCLRTRARTKKRIWGGGVYGGGDGNSFIKRHFHIGSR